MTGQLRRPDGYNNQVRSNLGNFKSTSYPQLELRGFSVPFDFLSFCFSYPRNWKSFFCHRCVVEV